MLHRSAALLILACPLLFACSDAGDDATSAAGGSGTTTSSGVGGSNDCTAIQLGTKQLVDTDPGASSIAFALTGLNADQDHVLYLEFYGDVDPPAAGAFDMATPPDDNYASCIHCLLVFEDVEGPDPTPFYPRSGVMNVTKPDTMFSGSSAGDLTGVVFEEVTLEGTTTIPIAGGRCLQLTDTTWDE